MIAENNGSMTLKSHKTARGANSSASSATECDGNPTDPDRSIDTCDGVGGCNDLAAEAYGNMCDDNGGDACCSEVCTDTGGTRICS